MKIIFLFSLLFLGVHIGVAQSASVGMSLVAAQEAFESGEYEQAIRLLDEFEKLRGASPRLESIRALALNELGRKAQALKALQIYFRLTANRDLSGNPAHQELVKLRDELSKQIDQEFESRKKKLDEGRERSAEEVVSELRRSYDSVETRIAGSSVSPPANAMSIRGSGQSSPDASKLSGPSSQRMSLAEFETWLKISESTDANDYFLFIETFPEGEFVAIARKRMMEIGDPTWNEVRNSYDPFKFRDFINANPDSPFLEPARIRMTELAKIALEWERISGGADQVVLKAFEKENPGHPLATEANRVRAEIVWNELGQGTTDARLEQFIAEFPESPRVIEARAIIEARKKPTESGITPVSNSETKGSASSSIIIRMPASVIIVDPKLSSSGGMGVVSGEFTFDGERIVFEQQQMTGIGMPDKSHGFSFSCSELKLLKYSNFELLIRPKKGEDRKLIPSDSEMTSVNPKTFKQTMEEKVTPKIRVIQTACGLPG